MGRGCPDICTRAQRSDPDSLARGEVALDLTRALRFAAARAACVSTWLGEVAKRQTAHSTLPCARTTSWINSTMKGLGNFLDVDG